MRLGLVSEQGIRFGIRVDRADAEDAFFASQVFHPFAVPAIVGVAGVARLPGMRVYDVREWSVGDRFAERCGCPTLVHRC